MLIFFKGKKRSYSELLYPTFQHKAPAENIHKLQEKLLQRFKKSPSRDEWMNVNPRHQGSLPKYQVANVSPLYTRCARSASLIHHSKLQSSKASSSQPKKNIHFSIHFPHFPQDFPRKKKNIIKKRMEDGFVPKRLGDDSAMLHFLHRS